MGQKFSAYGRHTTHSQEPKVTDSSDCIAERKISVILIIVVSSSLHLGLFLVLWVNQLGSNITSIVATLSFYVVRSVSVVKLRWNGYVSMRLLMSINLRLHSF